MYVCMYVGIFIVPCPLLCFESYHQAEPLTGDESTNVAELKRDLGWNAQLACLTEACHPLVDRGSITTGGDPQEALDVVRDLLDCIQS
jgi:hypothetical protein